MSLVPSERFFDFRFDFRFDLRLDFDDDLRLDDGDSSLRDTYSSS